MRLRSAMFFVQDFTRMKEFYAQLLRTQPVNAQWTDRWAVFQTGGADFALHAIPSDIADEIDLASPRPRETCPVKLTFSVDDVRAERARIEALGATTLQREWQTPDEGFEAVDPEGNILQITRADA